MRTNAAILVLLLASAAAHAQTRPFTCSFSSPPLDHPAAVLLGWPDLEHEALPPAAKRELRVHQDVAITVPDYSLRLVDYGRRVTGEVLVYWPGVDYDRVTGGDPGCAETHAAEARQLAQSVQQSLGAYLQCGPVQVRPRIEGCRVSFTADPGWAAMLRHSDSLGIWTLAAPVPARVGLDGVDISVELRDQAGYRQYGYNSPNPNGGSGEREVAALGTLVDAALAAAHAQFNRK